MSNSRFASAAVALLVTAATPLLAKPPNRIAQVGTDSTAVEHNVSGRTRKAADLGQAPIDRQLTAVTLHFSRTDAQQADLNQLLADQQNPASPLYRQWLTPQQFGTRFGLSAADITKVSAWLTSQALSVTGVAQSSTFVTVSGSIGQIQKAFKTQIDSVSLDGEQHIANISDPVLPTGIAAVVTGITGLDDFKPRSRIRSIHPNFTSSISGKHFIAPGDFNTIYDINPLLSSSINGSGVTIAVMGRTDINLADVAAFRSAAGLIVNAPSVIVYGTDPGTSSSDLPEAQLDVEWSGAIAPGAKILYVNSTDVIGISLVQAIDHDLAPILSISYGLCESGWGQAALNSYNAGFQQANAQGQTIVGPSGDSGATDCDYASASASDGLAIDFPASSPFVTAAGGTSFNEGAGSYWSTTNGTNQGSALSYIPELPWNETSATNGLAAGGGGSSAFFAKPAWQVGNGVPNDFARDTPDIALAAASSHDGFLYCVSGSCVNGFRAADTTLSVVGGTSVSAPSFAAILALLEQKISPTKGLGNINPTLYGLANSTYVNNVFHDVVSGNNASPCITGTPDCPTGGSIGYTAAAGYDRATGWGSLDVANFVSYFSLVTPSGVGTTIGANLTATTVTTGTSAATCGVATGTLPLRISVTGGSTTVLPSGTVQVLVDGVVVGTTSLTSGVGTYSLNTAALASGGHTVAASYLGSTSFSGSRGTLVSDVVSSSKADFALTPCTTAIAATAGTAASAITVSATPFNGFTGPVTFSVSSDGSFSGGYAVGTSPLTISGTTAGSTTVTLYAYTTNAKSTTGFLKVASGQPPSPDHRSIFAAGSGLTLAALILVGLPRRRRLAPLLVLVVSVGSFAVSGCGGSGNSINNTTTSGSTGTTTINKTPTGTYTLYITATATTSTGTLVHTIPVMFRVN